MASPAEASPGNRQYAVPGQTSSSYAATPFRERRIRTFCTIRQTDVDASRPSTPTWETDQAGREAMMAAIIAGEGGPPLEDIGGTNEG